MSESNRDAVHELVCERCRLEPGRWWEHGRGVAVGENCVVELSIVGGGVFTSLSAEQIHDLIQQEQGGATDE